MARESAYSGLEITWDQIMASKQDLQPKDFGYDKKETIGATLSEIDTFQQYLLRGGWTLWHAPPSASFWTSDNPVFISGRPNIGVGQHPSPLTDMVADRRFGDRTSRQLSQNPLVNSPCRVTLLARSGRIRFQNGIDERHHRFQGRPGAAAIATQRRQGALHRLTHHPAMNPKLPRHALYRADAELILPAQ